MYSYELSEAVHFPSIPLDDTTHICAQKYVIKLVSTGLTFEEYPV